MLNDKLNKTKADAARAEGDGSEYNFIEDAAGGDPNKNIFINSLDGISQDDIAPQPPIKKKSPGDVIFESARKLALVACGGVFIFCAGMLVKSLNDYREADALYDALQADFFDFEEIYSVSESGGVYRMANSAGAAALPSYDELLEQTFDGGAPGGTYGETPGETPSDGSHNLQFIRMKSNLEDLKNKNADTYGWIKIDGTKINYPLVQYTDNDYYLNHAYNGDFLVAGAIFVDYRCSRTLGDNKNVIFYGHHMQNGSMFADVYKIYNSKNLFTDSQIVIYTFDGIYTYEIFAVFKTVASFMYFRTDFASGEDFVAFCEEMQSKSRYTKNLSFTPEDKIITLSTCTNLTTDGRYALHAKLVKVER